MSSGCKSSLGCVDARVPVRATYVNLYKWPESDAEFVKSMTRRGGRADDSTGTSNLDGGRKWSAAPAVVDSYSCRQIYLRSYKFSREESVPEKTLRCPGRVRERAVAFPFLQQRNAGTVSAHGDANSKKNVHKSQRKKKKKKKKACVIAKKLRESSCSTLYFIFHRLLSCTATIDVVGGG